LHSTALLYVTWRGRNSQRISIIVISDKRGHLIDGTVTYVTVLGSSNDKGGDVELQRGTIAPRNRRLGDSKIVVLAIITRTRRYWIVCLEHLIVGI
jgi:hypothetical protein